jgi:hypothetical protein
MPGRLTLFVLCLCGTAALGMGAEAPPLLAKAFQRWDAGQGDLAFTQQTRFFLSNGQVKEERVERYDPSLPDSRRWRLIEVAGAPANDEQRRKWETHKNGRPRRKMDKSPSEYLELDRATLIGETPRDARFRIPIRKDAGRLLAVEDIEVVVTVDKQSAAIVGVGAALREPIRVLLGLARITDLDVDLRLNPAEEASPIGSDEVQSGSTARVTISKLGSPVEYNWSDFKRVTSFPGP